MSWTSRLTCMRTSYETAIHTWRHRSLRIDCKKPGWQWLPFTLYQPTHNIMASCPFTNQHAGKKYSLLWLSLLLSDFWCGCVQRERACVYKKMLSLRLGQYSNSGQLFQSLGHHQLQQCPRAECEPLDCVPLNIIANAIQTIACGWNLS